MRRRHGIGLVALAALVLVGAAVAAVSPTKLSGTVGPGFTITLRDAQGQPVTQVAPGEFEIQVDDRSEEHNFHLRGPGGVDVSTTVEGEGSRRSRVTLVDGRYTFVCDPHAPTMHGRVHGRPRAAAASAAAAAASATATAAAAHASSRRAPVGARLALTVGPGLHDLAEDARAGAR